MWITRSAAAALLVVMTGLPALAQPIEIATLGRAPLMGSSTNAAELKHNFEANQPILRRAARKMGLTDEQYATFKTQVEINNAHWVAIPRHLEKMTWATDGNVHVLSDVLIPAGQMGLEVSVPDGNRTLVMYLPAKCGNLSYIHKNMGVAYKPAFPQPHKIVESVANFPAPPAPLVAATGVSGTTAVVAPIVPPVAAAHFSLLPLAALLPFLIHGGGNGSPPNNPGTVIGPPPCP